MSDFVDWRSKSKHLPDFMRDFHDQKDIFKAMHEYFDDIERCPVSWVDGHVYTIDWFLWFMAAHGYTLQKTRAKVDFKDIGETLSSSRKRRQGNFASFLNNHKPA